MQQQTSTNPVPSPPIKYTWERPKKDDNGKCLHNVIFEGTEGNGFICGYCREPVKDTTNYE